MAKAKKILCPKCGTEYHIAEIYYPKELVGCPRDIIKDEAGKILGFEGVDAKITEKYICDKCNTRFETIAAITFETKEVVNLFDDDDDF